MCELRYAGSKNTGVFPAMEQSHWDEDEINGGQRIVTYAERFPKQYQQFKSRQQQTKAGTPLDYLPFLTEAKRAELRALNIYTAEALDRDRRARAEEPGAGRPRSEEPSHRVPRERQRDWRGSTSWRPSWLEMRAINQVLEDDAKALKAMPATPPSEFDSMTDEQLRAHIQSLTGVEPKGNLPRKTLIRMAQEQKENVAA